MTTINYTGRARIYRKSVEITLADSERGPAFTVQRLDLEELDLPPDSRIVVEAYHRTSLTRVDAGQVAAPVLPSRVPLTAFEAPENAKFRVKVVSAAHAGRLEAAAEALRPRAMPDQPGRSLLIVEPRDLGGEVWRLEIEDRPVLAINRGVGDWKGLVLEPEFRALVMPSVVRGVADWLGRTFSLQELRDGDGDPAQWASWFSSRGFPIDRLCEAEDVDRAEFIAEFVETFGRSVGFVESVRERLEEVDE